MGLHFLLIPIVILATLIGGGVPCSPAAPGAAVSMSSCPFCGLDEATGCGPGPGCCCVASPDKFPTLPQAPIQTDAPRIVLGLPLEPIRFAAALPASRAAVFTVSRPRSSDRPVRTLHCVWLT